MQLNNFILVSSGRVISSALQAIFYIIFAIILSPEEYGNLSYLIAIAGVASIISRFGLTHSIVIFQAKSDYSTVNQINLLILITTSIAAIILIPIDIFAAFLTLSSSVFLMYIHNLLGLKNYKKYFSYNLFKGSLIIVIPITGYYFFQLEGILFGMAIGYLLSSLPFFKNISFQKNLFQNFKNNFRIFLHNFGVDASTNLVKFIDKLVIAPIAGFAILGIYQLNLQILIGLEIIPIALHSYLLSEESSGNKHRKIIGLVILFSIFLVISIIFLSPIVIPEFFPQYIEGIESLQILVISLIPLTISSILNAKLQARNSTKVGYSAIIRIGSLLILLVVLGSQFGLLGLSYSVLLSAIFNTAFLIYIFKSDNKEQIRS
jgi:O-antigen/teichoic acid export membrane protein